MWTWRVFVELYLLMTMLDFLIIIIFSFKSVLQPLHLRHRKMVRGEESGSGSAGWRGGNASIVIVGFLLLGFDVVLKEEKTVAG